MDAFRRPAILLLLIGQGRKKLRMPLVFACLVAAMGVCTDRARGADFEHARADEEAAEQALAQLRDYVFQQLPRERPTTGSEAGIDTQAAAFVGREDLYDGRRVGRLPSCLALDADPVRLIAQRARETNIVIVNEHHSSPLDRRFIARLLPALREAGYTIYAAETFTRYHRLDDHPGVLGFDGWYSNEPVFGRTIGLARSLGYSLVAYEQTKEQAERLKESANTTAKQDRAELIASREQSQVDNLLVSIFDANPAARVVIHVGFSHAWENAPPTSMHDGNIWMAQRLKEATGRDPLTVSQVDCRSSVSGEVIARSRLAPGGEAESGSPVDFYVGHPPPVFREGRPEWRRSAGDIAVNIPVAFRNRNERVIVEARPEGGGLGEVPMDRVLLFPGEDLPLLLPPGSYRVDAFVAKGRIDVPPVRLELR